MKVLLLNPPSYPHTIVNRELMGGYGIVSSSPIVLPPLTLAYVAACLKKEGYEVNIYDSVVLKSSSTTTLDDIFRYKPDFIGLNTATATIGIDLALTNKIKDRLNVPIFVMGSHASILPNFIFENSTVDFVIRGEPELTSVELLKRYSSGKFDGIKALSYRQDAEIIHNDDRGKITDLDTLPFPARDLLPISKYYMPSLGRPFTTILASRGCFFQCSYCPYHIFQGEEIRVRKPENVFDEIIEIYYRHRIKYLTFRDAIFTFHKHFVLRLCELIITSKLNLNWTCETVVRFLDEELLTLMKKAGCKHISIGLESGNDFLQNKYSKNKIKSKEHTRYVFDLCKKLGIGTRGFFMIGYPEETRAMIKETIDFAIKANPDTVQFTAVTPFPGTELYNQLNNRQELSFKDMTGYRPININYFMNPNEIRKEIMRAYLKFYLRPRKLLQTIKNPVMFRHKLYRYFSYNR